MFLFQTFLETLSQSGSPDLIHYWSWQLWYLWSQCSLLMLMLMMMTFTLSPLSCTGSKSSVSIAENSNALKNWPRRKKQLLWKRINYAKKATFAFSKNQQVSWTPDTEVTLKWVKVQVFDTIVIRLNRCKLAMRQRQAYRRVDCHL